MDAFETITSRHVLLLAQQQSPPADFLDIVKKFREEIFRSGRDVLAPAERDQLRSILRFWTNYINQNSSEKIYETRDLEPFQAKHGLNVGDLTEAAHPYVANLAQAEPPVVAGIPSVAPKPKKAANWIWLAGIGLLAIMAVGIILIVGNPGGETIKPSPTATRGSPLLTAAGGGTQEAVNPTDLPAARDDDKDGLSNTDELLYGTDPDKADSDGDGLTDGEEVNRYKTDPLNKDTDGDGLSDGEEVNKTYTDPLNKDTDGDGITDDVDTNPGIVPTSTQVAPSNTATPTLTSTPTLVSISVAPTPEAVLNVDITSPTNGEAISPFVTFRGTYTNVPAGWTIHLVFKPLSRGGAIFPWREAYTVNENEPNGNWAIPVDLGAAFDLSKPDEYVVDLVLAYTDNIRKELLSGATQGLENVPKDAFVVNKPVVVSRQAYKAINEERIVYSAWLIDQQEQEVFSARLDGSDNTQITFSPDVNEDNPSLSSDGRQITFIDYNPKTGYSIWIMDSNGENRVEVYSDPKRVLEGPVFSPDGRYLAFGATEPEFQASGTTHTSWNIYLIDLKAGPPGKVDPVALTSNIDPAGNYISNRWPFWLDENNLIYSGFTLLNELVYKIDLDTKRPTRFYGGGESPKIVIFEMPVFLHTSNLLAFHSSDLNAREIYLANLPDGKPVQLTRNKYRDDRPRFSADGKMIVYESSPAKSSEIWTIGIDGRNAQRVLGDDAYAAIWPYVGKMVAYIPIKP